MGKTSVNYGWVIQDQAAVIKDLAFGPNWLKGQSRSGRVRPGYHNLIGKDIVFHGKGKHAFGAIIELMATMDDIFVRCGIREGMMIEKFVESEYGGGDDQIRVRATEDDIVRGTYYIYVFEPDKTYTFSGLVSNYGSQLTGFIPGSGWPGLARDAIEGIGVLFEQGSNLVKKSPLRQAIGSSDVVVVLTGKESKTRKPVVTHKHTHRISTLAAEIVAAAQP